MILTSIIAVTPAGQYLGDWVPYVAGLVGALVGLTLTVVLLFLLEQLWALALNRCSVARTWPRFAGNGTEVRN